MPRYSVTGPDEMLYDWLVADSPLDALHKLHAEALGPDAVRLVDGELVFRDPADQELCAGSWQITERLAGRSTQIEILPPIPAARLKSMAKPRKSGPRTKSGRLSRAYKSPELRDKGTAEAQAKRHALINGADSQLAATASGILLANGFINQDQHTAALIYARLHTLIFGKPWPYKCPLSHELAHHGGEPPENLLQRARERLDAMNARLTPEQRRAVANVAVFGFIPQFFYTQRLKLRPLPSADGDRQALIEGLSAIA